MIKRKKFFVQVINEKAGIPVGIMIEVEKENKKSYTGWWVSCVGTYKVTIKKEYAVKNNKLAKKKCHQ